MAGRAGAAQTATASGGAARKTAGSGDLGSRNIAGDHALLSVGRTARTGVLPPLRKETRSPWQRDGHQQIVETPTEARQAEPGPSVLALLTVSTGLAVLILGVVWFVFFRT